VMGFALDTPCPKSGHQIAPAEPRRVDFDHVRCPKCEVTFAPGNRLRIPG
jgi:hypothetical protein